MFPYKTEIQLDRKNEQPLYLQLCNQLIKLILNGKLITETRLPSSRAMASILEIHRKTVLNCYEELIAQGWILTIPAKGTFVNTKLPMVTPHKLDDTNEVLSNNISFEFKKHSYLERKPMVLSDKIYHLSDGIPDIRLAPLDEIGKIYRNILKKEYHQNLMGYGSIYGNLALRKALVTYLNQSRGINIDVSNILITRGSQMGIYLSSKLLLYKNKHVIVGATNYKTVDDTFKESKAILHYIPVDDDGIQTEAIEELCSKQKIAAVYATPHHHHPTTVTLSAARRMHLLTLANQYGFAIIEDDYDYDFHYDNAPILPLASNDRYGSVIYLGGFSKIVAPGIRIGYIVAPKAFIDEAAKLRRIIDRQGDLVMETTLATMLNNGDIQRHIKKALRNYKKRRDLFCELLEKHISQLFSFTVPNGGMAVWVQLKPSYDWETITPLALSQGIQFSDWTRYDNNNAKHQGMRFGFANFNEDEIIEIVDRLKLLVKNMLTP
ncbi:MocR-like pyridoxine biosynthesis transcription factor PdxR [Aquimarina rhabdastrellae]